MTIIRPFKGVRPAEDLASSVAALPYDVYNRKEAKEVVKQNPLSFLKIDRAETMFPDDTDMYSQEVYDKARDTLAEMIADGTFVKDKQDCYYLYALTMDGRTQTGIVGCASIDDYLSGVIRKHENTREEKELDRIRHVDTLSAQTGPIFLAYRSVPALKQLMEQIKESPALYDFTSEDGIRHQVWKIADSGTIRQISHIFRSLSHIYIADGHHRAASAVKTGLKRRQSHPDYNGSEEFNYFLSVLFPAEELHIYDYNRVITGLNGHTLDELLRLISGQFDIEEVKAKAADGKETVTGDAAESIFANADNAAKASDNNEVCPPHPQKKGEICMYGNETWYRLTAHPSLYSDDPVDSLDVSILHNVILDPVLGIKDEKTDSRIRFVGGIRGLEELVHLVDQEKEAVAFAMYPTSMDELLTVADAGRLMPPKSTWFEPKLRSGLFIHEFEHESA